MDKPIVHTLWIGDTLSAMEKLTLKSFIECGYDVYVWTYSKNLLVPRNIILKDAKEIISQENIFTYKHFNKFGHGKESYSGFSDIFRYKLLYEYGGIWSDMDITCLQPFEIVESYLFRSHHQTKVVGNFMKVPKNSALMQWCYETAIKQVTAENKHWLLPVEILKEGIYHFNLQQYIRDLSNNDSFPVIKKMLTDNRTDINRWKLIHWMNEEFRRLELDKNIVVEGSIYEQLLKKYHVEYTCADKDQMDAIKWKVSGFRYTLLNLHARLRWYWNKLF